MARARNLPTAEISAKFLDMTNKSDYISLFLNQVGLPSIYLITSAGISSRLVLEEMAY